MSKATGRTTAIDHAEFNSPRRTGRGKGEACLVVIYGPDLGHRATLARGPFQIGRASKCDLSIDQESVSRHHARISFAQGAHFIEDLGSTNGTYVGDQRIESRWPLRHGDQIKIGRSILKYMASDDLETNYHEEIYRLMTVDALTQTYNKRYFTEALEREQHRSVRYKRDLSLIIFDLDHFKQVNDTYGHVGGDAVLRQVAQAIRGKLREQDIFARIGGEEFAVLLPEVTLVGARTIAEKIRKLVENAAITYEDTTIGCTVSVGVAMLGDGAESAEQLVKAADAKLYEAKRDGRNRVAG